MAVVHHVVGVGKLTLLVVNLSQCLAYLLVTQLDFKALELDFLCQGVVFAVVLHVVELTLVALYALLGLLNLALLLCHGVLKLLYLILDFSNADVQTFNLVFQVLNFKGQLATERTFLVDGRQCGLKLIKGLQLLFY